MSNETPRAPRIRGFGRLLALVRPHLGRLAIATAALLVGSAISLVYPQALRIAIDRGIVHGSAASLDRIVFGVAVLFIVQAGLTWVRAYSVAWLGHRVVADLRRRVFERLVTLPVGYFHERLTGELTGRVAGDVASIEGALGSELSLALRASVQAVGATVLVFVRFADLALAMLAIVPLLSITLMTFSRRIRRRSRAMSDRLAESSGRSQEALSAITTVQAFSRERAEASAYGDALERAFDEGRALATLRASFMALSGLSGYLVLAVILWIGGTAVLEGEMSPGSLTEFLVYTVMLAVSLASLTELYASLERAAGSTERLFEILDTESALVEPSSPAPIPLGEGAVAFEHVRFAYPSRPDRTVIDDITLRVRPGERVAIVGPSGAGKSTLASLVLRFFDPTSGTVRIDGTDVRDLRLVDLRSMLAIVPQDPVLFSGSIAENIGYGLDAATREAIEEAATEAYALDFIRALPEGFETRVGERGVKLSGGQRQRIAIARALLRNPRVLVLDEATSALDAESEAFVEAALGRLMRGRTTLVIAHRLSTVRDADRICVVDAGRIVEEGSHDALMVKGGLYRRLVERQLLGSDLIG
jgi:ABC transporter fused permease/ATP-binding protein